MEQKIEVYHGTTRDAAQSILESQEFYLSTDPKEWLGKGIYFWQYPADARWWPNRFGHKTKKEATAVVAAMLTFEKNMFLDLDDPDQMDWFNAEMAPVLQELKKDPSIAPIFTGWKTTLCFLCNMYKKMYGIKVIAHTFPGENKASIDVIETELGLRSVPAKKQFCVTENSIISHIHIISSEKEVEDIVV